MHATHARLSRRTALAVGTAAALSLGGGTAHALPATGGVTARLRELEQKHTARLGVYARNLRSGRTVAYRADERFPMASVFKTLAAAAVLRDLDRDGEFLAKRVHYTQDYVTKSGYSPITKENVATGMTVGELCDATIRFSDNTAGNLLLVELGGPKAVTRFCRSIGDRVTRLDRWEPELNSAEPWRVTDTTSPRAIGLTYARLVLGDALESRDRARLTDWLLRNTTSGEKFRKALPADWLVADKTGGGRYGGNNDVGITWPPDGPPIVMSVLTTQPEEDAPSDNPLVADAAALLASELG
ncbi:MULTISPECIES: class A beta-lactamase [Streptomyces]|uniref:Beta-lactamase n=1 Tax=Streptomyces koelreuteriae TaxID=2838015 RepID=A0ABX8G0N1_9ACTN|nr:MULTISPECIES: class A beta-lactamase [Streptomyces]QWB27068.1 class A beta-lactamase [Streptomyces koelreuteriae]UUA10148.1 class A beta-lactamase [Streptomyces koelreuteriae]UUA17754.1 class A beta-lactamase [Streptomyces sp. CRCS-T-1]